MAKKKTQAEIAQMQQASAAGNSPVESAATNNDRVPLDSVNASQQPLTANMQAPALSKPQVSVNPNIPSSVEISLGRDPEQLLNKEQIKGNRELYKKAVEDAYNKAQNTEVTTEQTSLPDVKFQEHINTPYDSKAGAERVAKNAGLLSMIDEANKLNEEYKTKSEKASKQAKMAAWGNLFTALGQLAGGAKQTYVKPDSKYLTDAMAKSDKARDVYEAIKLKNKKAVDDYRAKLLSQDEAAHYAREKTINEGIDKRNNLLLEFAKANPTKVKKVYDPNAKQEMKIKQQTANAATKRAEAAMINANKDDKGNKEPFLKQTIGNITLSGGKAEAGALAQLMKSSGWLKDGKLNGVDNIDAAALQLIMSGKIENVDPVSFNRLASAFLSDEENRKKPEVAAFLNTLTPSAAKNKGLFGTGGSWAGFGKGK
jgi:hypothetical protein